MQILITGVSTGLGKAFLDLRRDGIEIFGVSRKPNSPEILAYSDFDRMPNPDVLILNAAMGDSGADFSDLNEVEFTEIIMSNLIKPILFTSELKRNNQLENLKSLIIVGSRFSSLPYISSQAKEDLPGYGYCISKVALAVFTQIIRKETLPYSVNSQLGNDFGLDVHEIALKLLSAIENDVFSEQFDGIYDLNTGGIIPF